MVNKDNQNFQKSGINLFINLGQNVYVIRMQIDNA